MEPDPGEIKAVLAYLGEETGHTGVHSPVASLSEIEDAVGFTASNALIYLRDRGVVETGSSESETYVALENNEKRASEFARTVEEEYGGDYTAFALETEEIGFLDYRDDFEEPDPEEIGINSPWNA
jgi:hypothetical protein